jgi:hypothetical protein
MAVGKCAARVVNEMRKTVRFLLIGLILTLFVSCAKAEDNGYIITWADPVFESAVRRQIDMPEGDIRTGDIRKLKIVYIWKDMIQFNNDTVIELDEGVTVGDVSADLLHFENLGALLFANMDFDNIDFVADYKKLQRIILYYNDNLVDISGIRNLPKLVTVSIHNNKRLKDYSPIQDISTLLDVDLHGNNLTDISFLEGLEKIRILSLHTNSIEDISPLHLATNMRELDLHANKISDISVIRNFERVYKVRLESNAVSDLSPLAGLERLSTLMLDKNALTDLTPLESLQALKKLSLEQNSLPAADIAALRAKLPSECDIVWSAE